ncbi:hypothetical protein SLEP1_g13373 [Rubroshorea leprosula]|uniref:Uncharacterized protein n=1 Tax=Rubroshorea leprosula TaxID=152421 RepID=A0AAV5IR24_9ROSI|nr:hypothetical protein SLEP1_g13373 [Rubroshorea leprosula]
MIACHLFGWIFFIRFCYYKIGSFDCLLSDFLTLKQS